ncbi:unnamed protein product [Trifolium pratense]|uniref:Uncharacterized protein n=1 Tax=Trifolium pratense TaxID=57577 RepID=A0ACB0J1B4_TRIPR|nr:unnamed protein product [Trifolium pratense]
MPDIEKLNNKGSTKSNNSKEHIELKVDSPRLKKSSTKLQEKKHKLKSKSHKLSGCTNAPERTATNDSSNKAPNKKNDSSNKRLIIRKNLHKTDRNSSPVQPSTKIQGGQISLNNPRKREKHVDEEANIQKRKRRRKKKKQKQNVDLDDTSRLQRRTRNLLIRMKQEQNLIDAYSGEGWKGQSREKIRPEMELQRAKKQILKCKLSIRDAIRQLDSLSSVGSIEGSVIAKDGSVSHEHIFCANCKMNEAFPDNDIILCDGTCNRAFHQRCLDPPLDTENIPPGDQGWFCKFCECKIEILEATNAHLGTRFSLDSTWQDVFKEEAAIPDGDDALLNQEEEWPSDDPEDDDYNPEGKEDSHDGINTEGNDENASDDSSSSGSMWSLNGECSLLDEGINLEYYSVNGHVDSDESGEIACGRRQRRAVDYKQLYDEMFGKDALPYEQVSEDEDWGPGKRRRREKESDAVNTLMTLHESENKHPNKEKKDRIRGDSSGIKRPCFRLPHDAVQKLRQVFAENELPPKSVKDALSQELGIDAAKVNKWFKNARYMALKMRKHREGGEQPQSITSKTSKDSTSQHVQKDEILKPEVSKVTVVHSQKKIENVTDKEKTKASSSPLKKKQKRPEIPPPLSENGNKESMEVNDDFNEDVSLMKLLKERKKKVGFAFEGNSEAAEMEFERLSKVKMKLDRLKQKLSQVQNSRSKGSDEVYLNEPSIIYVPVAELREKVK